MPVQPSQLPQELSEWQLTGRLDLDFTMRAIHFVP